MTNNNYAVKFDLQISGINNPSEWREAVIVETEHEIAVRELKRLRKICGRYAAVWAAICPKGDTVTLKDVEIVADTLAERVGWLKAAESLHTPVGPLARVFDGVPGYSPRYLGNPIPPTGSPHRLTRWIWKVWHRACQILEPYGWRPSQDAIRAAMTSDLRFRRVGRAAVVVAASSLPRVLGGGLVYNAARGDNTPDKLMGYNQAREVLIRAVGWGRRDGVGEDVVGSAVKVVRFHDDLTTSFKSAVSEVVEDLTIAASLTPDEAGMVAVREISRIAGCSIYRCYSKKPHGFVLSDVVMVQRGDRTYHEKPAPWDSRFHELLRCAIKAWRRQDALKEKAVLEEQSLLKKLGVSYPATVIVFKNDSRSAGNCEVGTNEWVRKLNGTFHNAIPYREVAFRGSTNVYVLRVAQHVAQEVMS